MDALILERICDLGTCREPLRLVEMPEPQPLAGEVRIRVAVCGVCHTELDEIEGRTPPPRLPIVPGHQVVGWIDALGAGVAAEWLGRRVGVAWIFSACGSCDFCRSGRENLCPDFRATGRDVHGGYARFMTVPAPFVHPIPDSFSDAQAAPLLCAGAIGFRSLRISAIENGRSLGLTGFGASAHLLLKLIRHRFPDTPVFVFSRSAAEREFAMELGACWSGDIDTPPPLELDAVIDSTPAWKPVVRAMRALKPGGRLVINAIRKEEADKGVWGELDYPAHLWLEKEIKSVANVTRRDVADFLQAADQAGIRPEIEEYPLLEANRALLEIKERRIRGAKVLRLP